ncbi:MAG: hypothetical protein ABID61_05955 [Candidatus Micrarchaeota archaeon]
MNIFRTIWLILAICAISFSAIDLMSIQANVYENGLPLDSGNVSVYIYDAASGGNLIWNQTYNNIIVNGTYDIQLGSNNSNNMTLNYGQFYYLELTINGVDQNFSGNDRQMFQSAVGNVNSSKIASGAINTTHISDGNVTTDKLGSGSVTADKIASGVVNSTHLVNNLSLGWGNLTSFPSACGANQFFSALGISPICNTFTESDPYWTANYTLFNDSWSSTYNSTYAAKAGTGTCPAGEVVQNTTLGGVQCVSSSGAPNVSQATGNLSVQNGGTGNIFMTLVGGEILYASSGSVFSALSASGQNGKVLTVNGGYPSWQTVTTNVSNVTGILNISQGGTGSNLYGMSNRDLIYANSSTSLGTITTSGNNGKVLVVSSGTPTWANITNGGVDTNLWDSNGLRTNNLSGTDYNSSNGYMIFGEHGGGSGCNTICQAHGLTCAYAHNITSTSNIGCSSGGGIGSMIKYCWCGN